MRTQAKISRQTWQGGNHKLVALHLEQIEMILKDKVECGWQLLLPRQAIHSIPNAILAPLGIVEQDMINEYGKIIPNGSRRMT
jgi:hypothetical protein